LNTAKFNGNLYLKSYLDWVQAIERIIKLKDYDDGKAFKLAILKRRGMLHYGAST